MKKVSKTLLTTVGIVGASLLMNNQASAFMGAQNGNPMVNHPSEMRQGQGMMNKDGERMGDRSGLGEGRSQKYHLVPEEMHEEFRSEFENLSQEEQDQLRQERDSRRQEHRTEMESLTGMTKEQVREARMNGEDIGSLLESKGVSEADMEQFLTEKTQDRVTEMAERHELSAEETATLSSRIGSFVQSIIGRWFN